MCGHRVCVYTGKASEGWATVTVETICRVTVSPEKLEVSSFVGQQGRHSIGCRAVPGSPQSRPPGSGPAGQRGGGRAQSPVLGKVCCHCYSGDLTRTCSAQSPACLPSATLSLWVSRSHGSQAIPTPSRPCDRQAVPQCPSPSRGVAWPQGAPRSSSLGIVPQTGSLWGTQTAGALQTALRGLQFCRLGHTPRS